MAALDDIRNRGEAQLTETLKRLNKKHQKAIIGAISRYGSLQTIPNTFWHELQKEIDSESMALMLLIFLASHDETEKSLSYEANDTLKQLEARRFAQTRANDLARKYIEHTRERLEKTWRELEQSTASLEELAKKLRTEVEEVLSDSRAERVAVTETTTSISGGQRGGSDSFTRSHPNYGIIEMWRTERDERVCPICSPLDGMPEKTWGKQFPDGPPAHVNCRCELRIWKVLKE